uniref:Reverse transcriptase, RNA-dependent DNA polymerase n=1 Tax=Tanacetum cinerariifolium TaxID=118510 RepID=A0A699GQE9_TANCI|nr:reverse transcriptase, RNA-dependent DNA polymerase [Tanacetum cinerariifolium]
MSLHGYIDDNFNVGDDNNITLISRLDASNPLHLHPNDSVALTVSVKLKGTKNYQVWSCALLLALEGKNKTGFIDGSCKRGNIQRSQTFTSFSRPSNDNKHNDNGIRLGHPADQVLDVLKSTLNFNNKESDLMCDTCQTAKQTREPFPLSDLVSTELRELVHLDFGGAYKVTSRDMFRYFFTIVDDLMIFYNFITTQFKKNIKDVDASASKSESFAALEKNNSSFEGIVFHDHSQEGINQVNNDVTNLRRSYRPSIFPRNFNDLVVDSKVKYVRRKATGSKWVFKIKYKSNCEIERFEARLVAKSFNHIEGIDFDETFSPVVKIVTIRCLINLDVQSGWSSKSDYSLFPKSRGDVFIALLVYVNDIIIIGNSLPEINKVIKYLKGSPGKGINVIKGSASGIDLKAYPDADWARCTDIRRSITGYCVFMCRSMVSWKIKKQNTISKSSTKAEHRTLAYVTSEVI